MYVSELIAMKKKVEEAKIAKARAEGSLEELNNKLVEEFDVKTIDEAEDLLADKEAEVMQAEQDLKVQMADLRERYDF